MIAAICLLIPPFVLVFVRSKILPRQEKFYHKIMQYLFSFLLLNGVILLIFLSFFTNGDRLIYNLNYQKDFALKYCLLAIALAVLEPLIERILNIKHISILIKVVAFSLICVVVFRTLNFIVQPVWESYDHNINGIYNEPENTLETIFLGTSHIRNGISPMELYKNYGICSYDISTSGQPTAASYYWLEEIYRLHAETLDTVIYDVSYLRTEPSSSKYHMAIDKMQLSAVKLRAVSSYSENFSDYLFNLIPLFSYHERWKELGDEDFRKYNNEQIWNLRGYVLGVDEWIRDESSSYSIINRPLLLSDESAEPVSLDEEVAAYFDLMVSFCEEHDIQLLLIKTPTNWESDDHKAVQALADTYNLDFIDFNVEPYYSEINFNLATDVIIPSDIANLHANYYGAVKITDFLGNYLIEKWYLFRTPYCKVRSFCAKRRT